MKLTAALALTAAAVDAAPHYTFPHIQNTADWQTVRMAANHYSNGPVTDVTSEAIRCYQLTPGGGGSTGTSTVAAGGTITWAANPNIFHPGPLSAYLAKVPAGKTLATWDGSGAVWFKVYQDMPSMSGSSMTWPSENKGSISFSVPSCIASGDYLARIEHVALHGASRANGAQFYISCAQISVTGGSGAKTPTDLVSFPGAYKPTDPGLMINIYSNNGKPYTPAGPPVFKC